MLLVVVVVVVVAATMSIICSYDHDVSIVITDSSRRPRCRCRLGRVARKKTSLFSLPNMFYLPKMTILQPACSYAMFSCC